MTDLATIKPEIPRDRYGRPLVVPQGGGKPIAYTRCTTYIDVLDDKYNLQQWMQRMVALGLASRPDLLLAVSAHQSDKRELNRICESAREAASASAAATTGTAQHALTELVDRGGELPAVLPPTAQASLDAYRSATADLKAVHIEQFCVQDVLKIGGTPDRIVEVDGVRYIADIKTGSIDWGALKIAMQLAVYARSHLYDHDTAQRSEHGADLKRGIIIHLPAVDDPADAKCDLHWVDLEAGWRAVTVATRVREQRALKFKDLVVPFDTPPAAPVVKPEWNGVGRSTSAMTLEDRIRACTTADQVRAMWTPEWTAELNELAKAHIASLPAAS